MSTIPILHSNSSNISNNQKRHRLLVLILIMALFYIVSTICLPLMLYAQVESPTLLQPANNSTNIGISGIAFSWSPSDNTTTYYLQVSTDSDFSSLVVDPEVTNNSYTLEITLEKDTKYYWRVTASQPVQSEWSTAFNFTTGTGVVTPTSTSTSTPTTEPTATTPSESEGSSFIDTIKGYIKDIGWPLILAIVVVLVVIVLLIFALSSKPKGSKNIPASNIARSNKSTQAGIQCPICGYTNTPDKKFCASCGRSMVVTPPQQYQAQPQHYQQPQQNQPQQAQGFTQSSSCPACRSANPPGSQFCGNCGSKLASQQEPWQTRQQQYQQPSACTNCGSSLQPGQKFCGNCGSTISTSGQQVAGVYQTFQCPICGANINRSQNPCPGCNTWLDWGI